MIVKVALLGTSCLLAGLLARIIHDGRAILELVRDAKRAA